MLSDERGSNGDDGGYLRSQWFREVDLTLSLLGGSKISNEHQILIAKMLKKCTTESEENWFSDHGGEWVKTQSS